jgi:hypothetical protein
LRKQKRLLKEHKTKITYRGLKYLDKLITIKEKEKKKREKEIKQGVQLLVFVSEISAPADTP